MLEKVEAFCCKQGFFAVNGVILLACSGGPDSLALTDIFLSLRNKYDLQLAAAHFDHLLRGEASRQDALFVAQFCRQRDLPCYVGQNDVAAYMKQRRLSAEEAARLLRYAFLRQTLEQLGGGVIATGHHMDDQAETVLLHLFRGAGSAGLSGIRPRNRDIIRPLLSVTRQEIEAYCQEKRLKPRCDPTNFQPVYTRNRIRLELLPHLAEAYNPSITEALCRSADLIGEEHAFFLAHMKRLYESMVKEEEEKIFLDRQAFLKLHKAEQRGLLREILRRKRKSADGVALCHVEACIRLIHKGRQGANFIFPGRVYVEIVYERLCFWMEKERGLKTRKENNPTVVSLVLPGNTKAPFLQMEVQAQFFYIRPGSSDAFAAVLDADKITPPLVVRTRQDGDRFQPSGMQGTKKIKDFFIENKVNRQMRDRVPLICDQNGILWIVGYRISDIAKVSEKTTRFLQLKISGGMAQDASRYSGDFTHGRDA